jgi:hypothetical protein
MELKDWNANLKRIMPHCDTVHHYSVSLVETYFAYLLELVSKELNHFGVIADLFRQIGGHSTRFVLFCSFWKTISIFFYFMKFNPPA